MTTPLDAAQTPAVQTPAAPNTAAPYSLRRRLLVWLFVATAALGLAALIDTRTEALRTAQTVSDRVLFGSALAIAEQVSVDEAGGLEVDIPYSSLEMLTSTAQDRVFYRVEGPQGGFLSGYLDLPMLDPALGEAVFTDGQFGGIPIRTVTLSREISTGDRALVFRVAVAESTRARAALARQILLRAGLRLAVLAATVAVIVWAAVTVALRPLRHLGAAIEMRSPADLRPVTLAAPREVGALLGAVNGFMGRLEGALAALRHFTGNASHQLRTPLAVVRTQLALIERSATPAARDSAMEQAKSALSRAERVLAQLLVLARVDGAQSAGAVQRVDAAEIARAMTAEMVPKALQAGIDLGFEGPSSAFALAEPVLLGELLKNLLDNAIAYAGAGAVVTVRLTSTPAHFAPAHFAPARLVPARLVLEVEDNGPGLGTGLGPAALARAQSGGLSGARSIAAKAQVDSAGYGLGLAICAEIAALFDAPFALLQGAGGLGLRVQVQLVAAKA